MGPYRSQPPPPRGRRRAWPELDAEIVVFVASALAVGCAAWAHRFGSLETIALVALFATARVLAAAARTVWRGRNRD